MIKPIRQVILTGDFLATRASEQSSNLRWIYDLLGEPIESAGLTCRQGIAFDRAEILTRLGMMDQSEARHCWIDADAFDAGALQALRAAVPADALIIGYELMSGTRTVLTAAGVPWIDIWLHPVRFCDDILMSFACSEGEIHKQIQKFAVPPESIKAQARLLKVQNYRGFNRPRSKLVDGSALLIGQTPMDKSILRRSGFARLGDHAAELATIFEAHPKTYFAPHPKAQRYEPQVEAWIKAGHLTKIDTPTYLLLADPAVTHVTGLSSSVIEEAQYFGKSTEFLIEPPVQWRDPSASVPIFQDFAFPHFWATIFGDVAHVTAHVRAGYLSPGNKLRDALSFDWGYPHINRDRFQEPFADAKVPESEPSFADQLAEADVISFDVFDTLITRRVADPRDVFDLLSDEPNFAQARLDAESKARRSAVAQGREDPTLSEIYAHLDEDPAKEQAEEVDAVLCRPAGQALFDAARASGKRIILVSDMYLDRSVIEQLLIKSGYSGWQALYLSSEIGAAKRSGKLWAHVLDAEGLQAAQLFHVGDNPVGDVARATEKGIKTWHLPKASTHFKNSGAWAKNACKADTAVLAHLQYALTDDGPLLWTPERFGYAALGPLLAGFAQWLQAQDKHLHFLTREGDVMRAVFEALYPEATHNTLFASRALVAPLTTVDPVQIAQGGLSDEPLSAFFARQFHLREDQLDRAVLEGNGFPSPQTRIGPRTDRAALVSVIEAHKALIDSAKTALLSQVSDYLKAQGVDENSALVDIGYQGTVQRAYSDIAHADLHGLYMGLFETAGDLVSEGRARGWLFEGAKKSDHRLPLCKHRAIWEALLCAPNGSVTGLEAGRAIHAETRDTFRQDFVRKAHAGAVAFAQDWLEQGNAPIDANTARRVLSAVLDAPDRDVAGLLGKIECDDPFEGGRLRPLIGSSAETSVWKEGFAASHGNTSTFRKSATGAQRPKWAPWGPYGLLGWRHILPLFVSPVIGYIGEPHDVDHYREDPIGFFRGLSDQNFRRIGKLLYPFDG